MKYKVGDFVVRTSKATKSKVWMIYGDCQIHRSNLLCIHKDEPITSFKTSGLRHATTEEIKAGRRL